MQGGINKVFRNLVTKVSSNSDFEKVSLSLNGFRISPLTPIKLFCEQRLNKATFGMDEKEPKEKHVICKFSKTLKTQDLRSAKIEKLFEKCHSIIRAGEKKSENYLND